MSWPLGYCKRSVRVRASLDGVIYANDIPVTEPGGWLDLEMPASARVRGAPPEVSVRVRVGVDAEGEPFLYAEQVDVQGRRYHSVHALIMNEGASWIGSIASVVHTSIIRAASTTPRETLGEPPRAETIRMRAVRTDDRPPSPDETWEPRPAKDRHASSD